MTCTTVRQFDFKITVTTQNISQSPIAKQLKLPFQFAQITKIRQLHVKTTKSRNVTSSGCKTSKLFVHRLNFLQLQTFDSSFIYKITRSRCFTISGCKTSN